MGNIRDIQDRSKNLRSDKEQLNEQLRTLTASAETTQSQIDALRKQGLPPSDKRIIALQNDLRENTISKESLRSRLDINKRGFADLIGSLQKNYDPVADMEQLDDSYPILMFPLRLETRFKKNENGQSQLWIRVYPDDVNVVQKETLLSKDELHNLRNYHAEMAKAGRIEIEERGAWRVLVNNHGVGRSKWLIEQYKPLQSTITPKPADHIVLVLIDESTNLSDIHPAGQLFWKKVWLAQADVAKMQEAEIELQNSGLTTAEINGITQGLQPFNIQDKIEPNFDPNKIIVAKINLPSIDTVDSNMTSWNEAAQAVVLPDRFLAVTYTGNNHQSHVFEHAVKDYLPMGLDPSLEEGDIYKDQDGLHLNEDLRWMVEFDEAVHAGMATRIDLSATEARDGFDKLFVLGMRVSSDPQSSKTELENLITTHSESKEGFEFIKQGTPTNNTEDSAAGYSWKEDADASFDRVFKGEDDFVWSDDLSKQADAQIFADRIGIDPAVLQGIQNANGRDHLESVAMNTALFPATLGYFMEEMMDPLFSELDIENTNWFFSEFVSGRGPIPAIKIGNQPYGILPVTNFSEIKFSEPISTHRIIPFASRIYSVLRKMDETWDNLVSQVSYVGKSGQAHQILLDVLGLHANSVEFHQRYAQSMQQIFNQANLQSGAASLTANIMVNLMQRTEQILLELGFTPSDTKWPILEKFFLSKPNKLTGPLVDDIPDSETKPIRTYTADDKNYLEWLHSSDGNKVRIQDFGGNPAPNALLYLLLRHSILLSQSSSATNFLHSKALIPSKKVYHDTDFLYIQEKEASKSKFEHLYLPNAVITGSDSLHLIQHIYNPTILKNSFETRQLNAVLDAIKVLENTPTARLERLLVEHLDCCSYRLDAWKTGIVNYRLQEQQRANARSKNGKGLHLGAYGWLLDLRPKNSVLHEKQLSQEEAAFFASQGEKVYVDSSNLGHIHAPSIDQAATAAILRNAFDSNAQNEKNPYFINISSERVRIANDFLEGIRNGQSLGALLGYQFERGLHDRYNTSNMEADRFIYPLRMAFPLVSEQLKSTKVTAEDVQDAKETNNSDPGIEAIEARNVIDGLKLIQHVQQSSPKTYPFGNTNLPAASPSEIAAITEEVNRIIDIQDAISDLLMAEQVYQVVKGNFERAAGVSDAFSKGSYPPEMEIVKTPRTGITLNHTMAIHFDADASATVSPNSVAALTARGRLEPAVNKWISDLLPVPETVFVKISVTEPGKPEKKMLISQKDLNLQSIDLLFLATLDNETNSAELDDRLMHFVLHHYQDGSGNGINPFSSIRILYTEKIDPTDHTKVSFFELGSILLSMKKILLNRSSVLPSSFRLPTETTQKAVATYDISDLRNRLNALSTQLTNEKNTLETLRTSFFSIKIGQDDHEASLASLGTAEESVSKLNDRLSADLKAYFLDSTVQTRDAILAAYELALSEFGIDPAVQPTLRTAYETYLNNYIANFSQLSVQTKALTEAFMTIALFDNNLTGTGFIQTALGVFFDRVISKINVVIGRWESKKVDYENIMAGYALVVTDEEKLNVLQLAERKLISSNTDPIPTDLLIYKAMIESQFSEFNQVLIEFKALETRHYTTINDFVLYTHSVLAKLYKFDIAYYDSENNRNDLYAELPLLSTLKENMYAAVESLIEYTEKKLSEFFAEMVEIDLSEENQLKIESLITAGKKLLNNEIIVLPRLDLSPELANSINVAYAQSESIQQFAKEHDDRDFPIEDWIFGVARVRSQVWELENIISLVPGFKASRSVDLKPLQFPYRADARWLALKFLKEESDANYDAEEEKSFEQSLGDSLLYTAHFATAYDTSKKVCGIILDEWTEVIPGKEETTGIAFHYDQPNSEPPQTMLLVTPSEFNGKWDWEDLLGAMNETLSMAKKRAVEPSMVSSSKFGQFLPTTLMAVTSHLITVAMNLASNNIKMTKQ